AAARGSEEGAEQKPVGIVDTTAEGPLAGNPIAAVCRCSLAHGRETRGRKRILRPVLVLKLFWPQGNQEVVNGKNGPDPTRRSVAAGELVGNRKSDIRPDLGAAELLRLEEVPQTGVPDVLDCLVRDTAGLIGRCGSLPQNRCQPARLLKQDLGDISRLPLVIGRSKDFPPPFFLPRKDPALILGLPA